MLNCQSVRLNAWQIARKLFLTIVAGLIAAIMTTVPASAGDFDGADGHEHNERYAIGLWGDFPYSTVQATVGVPNLIADMNKQNLAFTAHDGDLKSGSSECTDAVYTQALAYFGTLRAPAIFTPGD